MTKLCPFRKTTTYESGRNTGMGYPDAWVGHESFCECVQDKCIMWNTSDEFRKVTGKDGWCKMSL